MVCVCESSSRNIHKVFGMMYRLVNIIHANHRFNSLALSEMMIEPRPIQLWTVDPAELWQYDLPLHTGTLL